MAYSYTEKKRIRKSFAKRAAVLNVPFLLATQIESFASFLQAETPPLSRLNHGLQAAFTSIFPISSTTSACLPSPFDLLDVIAMTG